MIRKFLVAVAMMFAMQFASAAFAASIDVNTADKAALQSIKDVGPKTADAILAERQKGGKFKDWDDLVKRVKGVGSKNSIKMSQAGLTVDGAAKPDAPAKAKTTASDTKSKAKAGKGKAADASKSDTSDAKSTPAAAPDKSAAAPAPADKAKDTKADAKK